MPAGWSVESVQADGKPEWVGGELVWTGALPPSPVRVVYAAHVPLTEVGRREVGGYGECWQAGMDNPAALTTEAGPLVLEARDDNHNGLPDAWERHYAGAAGVLSPTDDADGDGMNNLAECLAGTDPTDAASVLRASVGVAGSGADWWLQWSSVSQRVYAVDCATGLQACFSPVATGLWAMPPRNTYWIGRTSMPDRAFFRVRIEP